MKAANHYLPAFDHSQKYYLLHIPDSERPGKGLSTEPKKENMHAHENACAAQMNEQNFHPSPSWALQSIFSQCPGRSCTAELRSCRIGPA